MRPSSPWGRTEPDLLLAGQSGTQAAPVPGRRSQHGQQAPTLCSCIWVTHTQQESFHWRERRTRDRDMTDGGVWTGQGKTLARLICVCTSMRVSLCVHLCVRVSLCVICMSIYVCTSMCVYL